MTWNPITFMHNTFVAGMVFTKSSASGYGPEKLIDTLETTLWKSLCTSNSAADADELTYDVGNYDKTIDYFAIGGHNLSGISFSGLSICRADSLSFIGCGSYVGSLGHIPQLITQAFGYIYEASGVDSAGTMMRRHSKFDPATQAWTSVASCPEIQWNGAYTNAGQYNYLVGGFSTNVCWRYDISQDSWTQLASMTLNTSMARMAHAQCEHKGNIYVYGGQNVLSNSFYCDIWRYNISTNSWTLLSCNGIPRYSPMMISFDDYIYIHGGVGSGSLACSDMWKYNPNNNTWTQCACSPVSQYGAGTWIMSGEIYYWGSTYQSAGGVWRYNPTSNTWFFVGSIWQYRGNGTVVTSNALYSAGTGQNCTQVLHIPLPLYPILEGKTVVASINNASWLNSGNTSDVISFAGVTGARYWQFKITQPNTYAYATNAWFGKRVSIGYSAEETDPNGEETYAYVSIGQTGIMQGMKKNLDQRQFDITLESIDDSIYQVLKQWRAENGIRNMFVQWETSSHAADVWLMYPDAKFYAPMLVGGVYRKITIELRGRKA